MIVFGIFMLAGFFYLGYSYLKTPAKVVNLSAVKNYEWVEQNNTEAGVSFKYPQTLLTQYMHVQDWPPQIVVSNNIFSCTQAGSEIAPGGKSILHIINMHTYCVTTEMQGAAGSMYTQYAYAAEKNGQTLIATFSIRAVQCGNYEEPKKTECEQERASFDLDTVVDQIFESIKFLPAISASKSGITGSVLLGPICPVMRNPPDPQCADKPYAVRLIIAPEGSPGAMKEFSSDANGKFNLSLTPGIYEIQQAPTRSILPRCAAKSAIEVATNTYTKTTIYCDTGIR